MSIALPFVLIGNFLALFVTYALVKLAHHFAVKREWLSPLSGTQLVFATLMLPSALSTVLIAPLHVAVGLAVL